MMNHYDTDAKLRRLYDARQRAEYELDEAINRNGIGHPDNAPYRNRLYAAEKAIDKRRDRLDGLIPA